jgi:purine-binding chemotaxis protein CheW
LSTETLRPAEPVLPEAPPAGRACVVLLGGRAFAVDVTDVREVVVLDAITPVPGAPSGVIGLMNLRGTVLPVVEARPLLGLPIRARGDRALVLADGARRAAVVVEGVLGLVALDRVHPASTGAGEIAVGEPASGTTPATLLDARAMLAAIRRRWDAAPSGLER